MARGEQSVSSVCHTDDKNLSLRRCLTSYLPGGEAHQKLLSAVPVLLSKHFERFMSESFSPIHQFPLFFPLEKLCRVRFLFSLPCFELKKKVVVILSVNPIRDFVIDILEISGLALPDCIGLTFTYYFRKKILIHISVPVGRFIT